MDTTRRRRPLSIARIVRFGWVGLCLLLMAACHYDMYDQPKHTPLTPSEFFADGRSARQPVAGAMIAGQVRTDEYFFTGLTPDGKEGAEMPFPVTAEVLDRGQEKFNIYCAPCHGLTGQGNGMISQRGAITAANFHQQRLIDAPIGHFYYVITNGYRYMYPYATRIEPADRWAIAAYLRALQLSQNATIDDVPPDQRSALQ